MKTKEDTKKSLPEPTFTNLESFDSWVQSVNDTAEDEKEPFCPYGSKSFGYGYCDGAYSYQCYVCKFSKEAYEQRLMDKYWGGLEFPKCT